MKLAYSYNGRTVSALKLDPPEGGQGQVHLRLGTRAKLCTGLQKLAQRVVILLLTAPGTVFFRPKQGTVLGDLMRSNIILNESLLRNHVILSLQTVLSLIQEEQDATTADDEYLVQLSLVRLTLTGNNVACTISLTTKDNSTYVIPLALGELQ